MPYVCVSGNTGAGKSTLLGRVGEALMREARSVHVVDESTLHHPLLYRMFDDPTSWGFVIQVNFIIQRIAKIMDLMADPNNIMVMERSPSEDALFFERLSFKGFIEPELDVHYYGLSAALQARAPKPLGYIFLQTPPDICLARLHAAVINGSRPVELEGRALEEYVWDMDKQYKKWRSVMSGSSSIYDLRVQHFDGPEEDDVERCISIVKRWIRG